jgi:hypothetical protein
MTEVADRLAINLDIRHHGDFWIRILDFVPGVNRRAVEFR